MKRKNILFRTHIIAVLFLLFLSPVSAQNSYIIGLDSLESFGIESGSDVLNVSTSWTFEDGLMFTVITQQMMNVLWIEEQYFLFI